MAKCQTTSQRLAVSGVGGLSFGSICSGIEAASVAWHPLGWRAAFFSEIEKFPCHVLEHHYGANLPGEALPRNGVPNLGDMTKFKGWPDATIDVLVGGTPCQSFSLAGLRKGLADPRGNLMLTYLAIAERYRPRWLVWENVPGVLSDKDNAFGALLGGMGQLGYGFAYRVLDAQYIRVDGFARAVPQRRRRVFVVGCAGSWQRAAAVFFERESLLGNPAPRREAGKAVAAVVTASAGERGANGAESANYVAHTLNAKGGSGRGDAETETFVAEQIGVAHALKAEGHDASEDGTGRGTPIVPLCFTSKDHGADAQEGVAPTLRAIGHSESHANAGGQLAVVTDWRVRRLMPVECERLQGFPDGYTAIRYRGKEAADGPRYKALGNSMAVNVMRWIGQRIAEVDAIEGADNGAA